jgi:Leucine-rich repeat (LRR) protein
LDLSGLGLVSLHALSEMKLDYLDCSGNKISDYSPLLRMPLKVLVTDDGIIAGRMVVRRYLLNKVHRM